MSVIGNIPLVTIALQGITHGDFHVSILARGFTVLFIDISVIF